MQIKKDKLIDFLGEIDKEAEEDIELIAVGGTAMTLLGLKTSTIDVDFELRSGGGAFRRALKTIPHGFKVDIFGDGLIFSQQLPEDHYEMAIPIKTRFGRIRLYALNPIDIVVTKIGRLSDRDVEDIGMCIKKHGITRDDIIRRAGSVDYTGREENYAINLDAVIKKFF